MSLGPAGPGQQQDVTADPAYYPRPTGEEAAAAGAPPPPFLPGNCEPRFMRLTVNAIPAQQARTHARMHARMQCRRGWACWFLAPHASGVLPAALRGLEHGHQHVHASAGPGAYAPAQGPPGCAERRQGREAAACACCVQAMRARFQLPFGAIVHPMAGAQDLPVIGLDAGGIVRCRRCRTYINPFVTWSDNGRCGAPIHSPVVAQGPKERCWHRCVSMRRTTQAAAVATCMTNESDC